MTSAVQSLGLQIQDLPSGTDRVLVLASIVAQRSGDGAFSPSEINQGFDAFRVPAPSNTSQTLAQLRARGFVIKRREGGWSLTPRGEQRVIALLGELPDPGPAKKESAEARAELGEAGHTVIPPFFAPSRWAHEISRFLERNPFDENVFCMTRFPSDDETDPLNGVIETARSALRAHGLRLHLASDAIVHEELWSNVAAYLWACRYGIALLENRVEKGLNYNLVIEVGAMLATGRRCALLKDTTQGPLPTDLVGHIYRPVDFEDLGSIERAVHDWAANDLGFGACRECPPEVQRSGR